MGAEGGGKAELLMGRWLHRLLCMLGVHWWEPVMQANGLTEAEGAHLFGYLCIACNKNRKP